MSDDILYPLKPNDWVRDRYNDKRVAQVRDVCFFEGEFLVDLWIYDRNGNKIGRESRPMGGPRSFEPMCAADDWVRLEKEPIFPLRMIWVPDGKGNTVAQFSPQVDDMPPRQWRRPTRRAARRKSVKLEPTRNVDLDQEASKLRFVAQELRDTAREMGGSDILVKKAERYEAEAAALLAG